MIRRLARPLLASIFIYGGIQALRNVDYHVQGGGSLLQKASSTAGDALPEQVPTDPASLVKADSYVKVAGGAMLALGKCQRMSSLLLSGSLLSTTLAAHSYWEVEDPQERANQQVQFIKNLGLLGGLLLAAVDTKGKPSVKYRAKKGAHKLEEEAHHAKRCMKRKAKKAADKAAAKADKAA